MKNINLSYDLLNECNNYSKEDFDDFLNMFYPKRSYNNYKTHPENDPYVYLLLNHLPGTTDTTIFYKYFIEDEPEKFLSNLSKFNKVRNFS